MRRLTAIALVWCVVLPGITARRVSVWRSDQTLWADACRWSVKPRPYVNLGGVAYLDGRHAEARQLFLTAMMYSAGRPVAERDLAWALAAMGVSQTSWALGQYRFSRALAADLLVAAPEWPIARYWCETIACHD